MSNSQVVGTFGAVPERGGRVRGWQGWAPYAAVAWSIIYAALGVTMAVSGRWFPFPPESASDVMAPLLGRFGPVVAWTVVLLAGIPAAAMGAAMLRGVRGKLLRPVFISAGTLLAGALLLLMTSLNLLVRFGYIPITLFHLIFGGKTGLNYAEFLSQWTTIHQLLCMGGGFLWLAATVCYARRSGDACLYCGRKDGPQSWQAPEQAARWGRIAVMVALLAPVFYALTRFAWALGIPLGMTEAYWREGQARGTWTSGLFLASFTLLGGLIMLGLVQRWGEVFPRWMIGLAGRRVPIALAVIPAALASVLLVVGGIAIWTALPQMVANLPATGMEGPAIIWGAIIQVGPTLLFPLWGAALAVATLGYYYRRRGPCNVCGR